MCDLSVVVPTYNERERLAEMIAGVAGVLAEHGIEGEIIVVDDNSPDGTGELADRLSLRFPVRVLHREGKLGLGSAVIHGFGVARGRALAVMDADLSHPPAVVARLFAVLHALDVDAVVGSRYVPGGGCTNWPWGRLAMSRVACALARPLTPVRDAMSGLFVVKRDAVEGVQIAAAGFKIGLELLLRGRIGAVAEVPYVFAEREGGQSKMSAREVLNFLLQLRALYATRFLGHGTRPTAHRRVSVAETHAIVDRRLAATRRRDHPAV